jgi:hypothetical protein
MKKSLTDILIDALLGKKIKLYKVIDKQYKPEGIIYYLADKDALPHPKKCEIIEETHGTIKNLNTEHHQYEGDGYYFDIFDDEGIIMNVNGLYSITSSVEILN